MSEALSALIPPVVMAVLFVALVITAARATDWSNPEPVERPNRAESVPPPSEARNGDSDDSGAETQGP